MCYVWTNKKKHETMDNINNSNVLHHNGHTFFLSQLWFFMSWLGIFISWTPLYLLVTFSISQLQRDIFWILEEHKMGYACLLLAAMCISRPLLMHSSQHPISTGWLGREKFLLFLSVFCFECTRELDNFSRN